MTVLVEPICLVCIHFSNNKWGKGICGEHIKAPKQKFNDGWCEKWEIKLGISPLITILMEENHRKKIEAERMSWDGNYIPD